MIETFSLIRNIGTFDNVNSGAQLPLNEFALIYAENGRGKTTLAAILRSLASGDPLPILERRRLGSQHPPHVVIAGHGGQQAVFQNGAWANRFTEIVVFDDQFVFENVCSGLEVESGHRQNLHELIIGAQGVALNAALQGHVDRIEQHNRDLQAKTNAIPREIRAVLNVDDFCALENRDDIDDAIQAAERNLFAARRADQVRQKAHFVAFTLPGFDVPSIETLLGRDLPQLEAEAAARVQEHLRKLGRGGEAWVGEGVHRIEAVSEGAGHEVCPFCAQDLGGSPLIAHYQAYFSAAYGDFKSEIARFSHELNAAHGGEVQTAFERAIRIAEQTRQFWKDFTDIPELTIDTAEVALAWKEAYQAVSALLSKKQASPLESLQIGESARQEIADFHTVCERVNALSAALTATRAQIDLVKEKAAAADVAVLENDLTKLKSVKARYRPDVVVLCDSYLQEKAAKIATEQLRDAARASLDQYRNQVFPQYETAINDYLQRFNAGFRLDSVSSVNTRAGSTCNYAVLINTVPVPLSARNVGEPSFKSTLSAGDRNALALAFFFGVFPKSSG